MNDEKTFAVISVNYKNGQLSKMDELRTYYEDKGEEVQDEGFVLDTCNRFEHYFVAEDLTEASQYIGQVAKDIGTSNTTAYYDKKAVKHGMRVASGLESAALGDDEILKQFKEAFRQKEINDKFLNSFFESTVQTAKKVRDETCISEGTVSITNAAVNEAKKHVDDFKEKNVAVIGAGDVGKDLITTLEPRVNGEIYLVNRTVEKAEDVIQSNDVAAEAFGLSELEDVLWNSQVVFSATSASEPVVGTSFTVPKDSFYVDLANPGDLDLPDDYDVLDLDYINSLVDENQEKKLKAAKSAMHIIHESYLQFERKNRKQESAEIVKKFKKEVDKHKQENLDTAESRIDNLDTKTSEVLGDFADGLTNDIMGDIIRRLHELAVEEDEESLEVAERILTDSEP